VINRNKKSTNNSAYTIKQLNDAIKDMDDCVSILSKQLLPENLLTFFFYGVIIYLDILLVQLYNMKIEVEPRSTFLPVVMLVATNALVYKLIGDVKPSLDLTALSEADHKKIKTSMQLLGIESTSDTTTESLENFKHRKKDVQKILSDKKAWHMFSMYNYNRSKHFISRDITNHIKEFIFPKHI